MEEDKKEIQIIDKSGDKDFFTIIPNMVINHSTAIQRALYLEMKRFGGEEGRCFATEETMMKRLKVGKISFDKALNYLLSKKWIEFIGFTESKTRPIKTYKISNIWQENSKSYKKIPLQSDISQKDTSSIRYKIPLESDIKENIYKEDISISKDIDTQSFFNLEEEIKKLENSPRRDLGIIAYLMREKKLKIENKGQFQVILQRHLPAAKNLKSFSDKQITNAGDRAERELPGVWTLETLVKLLTK